MQPDAFDDRETRMPSRRRPYVARG